MRTAVSGAALVAALLVPTFASAELQVGAAARVITPVGPSPVGWNFVPQPTTGVWGEAFQDANENGCYDLGELFTDDLRNTLIDPQSAGRWDGIWTNAGFGGKCALGKLDDTWARAVVLSNGVTNVALVSLDVVGFFNEEIVRIEKEIAKRTNLPIHALLVSSTHTHEGPDTMGLWGQVGFAVDGKFPIYQKFIRSQVVDAIEEAFRNREPARVRFGQANQPLGLRDSRPPEVKDEAVVAAQYVAAGSDPERTIATIVNWGNHPEALSSRNNYISSDFPHATREYVETALGGISVYFSSSVGGLMTPLGRNDIPGFAHDGKCNTAGESLNELREASPCYQRMLALGDEVGRVAVAALDGQPLGDDDDLAIRRKEMIVPIENLSLAALNLAGALDRDAYVAGVNTHTRVGQGVRTEMVAVTTGPAVFLTVPGELFPEIEIGGYGRDDCPEADTGRPHEPVIRDQWSADTHPYLFVLGLGQDELGYIVPGYDFWIWGLPPNSSDDVPLVLDDRPRAVAPVGVIEAVDPCGESHYEETVSAGSTLAPLVACTAAELAGHSPWNDPAYPACSDANMDSGVLGIKP